MYCPQVINDGSLVLSILSTPRAVSVTSKMPEGIGVMDPFRPMTFGDSLVDTALRNFNPLGREP